jgi:hypothetical protein
LEQLGESSEITSCSSIGTSKYVLPRPIRFTLKNSNISYKVLRKAKKLRDTDRYEYIHVSPYQTIKVQKVHEELVAKLKQQKDSI